MDGAVGGSSGKTKELFADGLNSLEGGLTEEFPLQVLQGWHLPNQLVELLRQGRNDALQQIGLFNHLRQQEPGEEGAHAKKNSQHQHQGGGAAKGKCLAQPGDGHVEGDGEHHSSEENQQHPAQLPHQKGGHHQGQGTDQVAGVHG